MDLREAGRHCLHQMLHSRIQPDLVFAVHVTHAAGIADTHAEVGVLSLNFRGLDQPPENALLLSW